MPITCKEPEYPPGVIGVASSFLGRYREFDMDLARVLAPPLSVVEWRMGVNVAHHYNNMIRTMLKDSKLQWVWILGDDHVFRPDTLFRLLAHQVDMVTPFCLRRSEPYEPVLHTAAKDGYRLVKLTSIAHEKGLFDMTDLTVGNAGTLLSRRLCEAIEGPWFVCGKTDPEYMGSDLYFCELVRKAGFRMYMDMDTTIGHLTHAAVWPVRNGNGTYQAQLIGPGATRPSTKMKPDDVVDWQELFNDYRNNYDKLPFENHQKFYGVIYEHFPSQRQYNLEAVKKFLRKIKKPGVVEIGGWQGELAQEILESTMGKKVWSWVNYEICREAVDNGYDSPKYSGIALKDFFKFDEEMLDHNTLIMSHVLEHMKYREFAKFLDEVREAGYPFKHIYLDAPIPDKTRYVSWHNYVGTHVLEVGWEDILKLLKGHGYKVTHDEQNIKFFKRGQ